MRVMSDGYAGHVRHQLNQSECNLHGLSTISYIDIDIERRTKNKGGEGREKYLGQVKEQLN